MSLNCTRIHCVALAKAKLALIAYSTRRLAVHLFDGASQIKFRRRVRFAERALRWTVQTNQLAAGVGGVADKSRPNRITLPKPIETRGLGSMPLNERIPASGAAEKKSPSLPIK